MHRSEHPVTSIITSSIRGNPVQIPPNSASRPAITAAGAAMGCIQMVTGAAASGLVVTFYDGHSALSMTALMAAFSLLALTAYLLVARPAECTVQI